MALLNVLSSLLYNSAASFKLSKLSQSITFSFYLFLLFFIASINAIAETITTSTLYHIGVSYIRLIPFKVVNIRSNVVIVFYE